MASVHLALFFSEQLHAFDQKGKNNRKLCHSWKIMPCYGYPVPPNLEPAVILKANILMKGYHALNLGELHYYFCTPACYMAVGVAE